jgi:UBX domain-containing protein 1/4
MSEKQQLIDMGFDPVRVDWALKATKGKGLQVAMDHLVEHSEKPVPSAEEQGGDDDAMDVDEGLIKVGDTANVRDVWLHKLLDLC